MSMGIYKETQGYLEDIVLEVLNHCRRYAGISEIEVFLGEIQVYLGEQVYLRFSYKHQIHLRESQVCPREIQIQLGEIQVCPRKIDTARRDSSMS